MDHGRSDEVPEEDERQERCADQDPDVRKRVVRADVRQVEADLLRQDVLAVALRAILDALEQVRLAGEAELGEPSQSRADREDLAVLLGVCEHEVLGLRPRPDDPHLSPFSTFHNWGSSSSLLTARNWPIGVKRLSFTAVRGEP